VANAVQDFAQTDSQM